MPVDAIFMEIGAGLDDTLPVESIRYLGPKSKRELNAIGIKTVGDLKSIGVIDAYLMVKARGWTVNINFVWAMYAGLLGVDFDKIPAEFKEAVRKELAAAK